MSLKSTSILGGFVLPVKSVSPSSLYEDNEFQYIDIASVDRDTRSIFSPQTIQAADAPSRARQLVQTNDIIVSTVRPNLNTVAQVVVEYHGAIASTGFCVLRANPEVLDHRYLYHWISSQKSVDYLVSVATGASYPAVSDKIIKGMDFDPPPLEEQKRIAAILDKADSLRRKRAQAIALADDFLRATFLDMFGDPVTNPKGWPVGTIRDLVNSVNYGTSSKADETEGQYPILRMMNITYEGRWDFSSLKYIDLSENEKEKYLAIKGDLLFNRTNSKELVGKTAVFESDEEMAIAGYLIRARTNGMANPYYIAAYLNSPHGKQTLFSMCKSIVGMANINAQELQNIRIQIPPIELQNKYASIVADVRKREALMLQSEKAHQQLSSALANAFF
jgi:type I restriction enzyme S subunit